MWRTTMACSLYTWLLGLQARAPFRHSSPPVQSQMQSIFTACGPCIWLHKEARRESTHLTMLLYGWEYTMVVKVLLSNGASLDVGDKTGKRPIDYASEGGFSEMVDLLLAAGAKPPR